VDETQPIDEVFRRESGQVLATLIRFCGDFDLAEDAVQDTFLLALERWPGEGVPPNPGAWITTAAKRRAIDRIRREVRRVDKEAMVSRVREMPDDPIGLEDDQLRLIFTCCHPALTLEARVALTLRTVCGLATGDLARAFMTSEATMAQRLVRAKRKIQVAGIAYRVPAPDRMGDRLAAVLAVVYLMFNEGYTASAGDTLARDSLTAEAMRVGELLCRLMPGEPEVLGLQALMLLNHSRRDARVDASGAMVLMSDQDRRLWDRPEIERGLALLRQGTRTGSVGQYWLQAAIVAEHAHSPTAEATDWHRICRLYDLLFDLTRSPVVQLNRSIAVSMADGPAAGLQLLEPLAAHLDGYLYFHSAAADMHRRLGANAAAAQAYRRALALATNDVQRAALDSRLHEVTT
jgi:RNA polymerase sigma-70 factor (ECF subfamily)